MRNDWVVRMQPCLAVGVDTGIDQALQDQLGEFILQSRHSCIKGHGHLVHVR